MNPSQMSVSEIIAELDSIFDFVAFTLGNLGEHEVEVLERHEVLIQELLNRGVSYP